LGVKAAGVWGLRPHHLHVPNVMKIWEPTPSGTLWATLGLLRDSFTLVVFTSQEILLLVRSAHSSFFVHSVPSINHILSQINVSTFSNYISLRGTLILSSHLHQGFQKHLCPRRSSDQNSTSILKTCHFKLYRFYFFFINWIIVQRLYICHIRVLP